jgi:thiol-disulfide isomerase/thioredoxin
MRAAERRREQRRRLTIAGVCVVVVLLVLGGLVGLKAAGAFSHKKKPATPASAATPALLKTITTVPPAALNAVGIGTVSNPPTKVPTPVALTANGKPKVLYIGAEYCPYCAAERWGMAIALSRFGTLTGLGVTHSSSSDVDPNTPTLSFHGSSFVSKYLTFTPYEETTNQPLAAGGYQALDTVPAEDSALQTKFDAPPYVPAASKGAIPFVDFGGYWILSGASYDPGILAGKSQTQVAAALSDPTSTIAKAILGTANTMTGAICTITKQEPADVCTQPGVITAESALAAQ